QWSDCRREPRSMCVVAEATRRRHEIESSIRRRDRRRIIREWALHRQDVVFGTDRRRCGEYGAGERQDNEGDRPGVRQSPSVGGRGDSTLPYIVSIGPAIRI